MNLKNSFYSVPAVLALACAPASTPPASPTQETSTTEPGNCPCAANHGANPEQPPGGGHGHAGMHMAMHEGMAMSCPMKVPGTTVTLNDLPGAVALEFVTSGDVAELRRRVAEMAEHHQRHQRSPSGAHGPGEASQAHSAAPGESAHAHHMMVPAQVRVEETANGARLVFTPEQATDLRALREHIEKRSKHMEKGDCGMMSAGHPPAPEEHAVP